MVEVVEMVEVEMVAVVVMEMVEVVKVEVVEQCRSRCFTVTTAAAGAVIDV